ncbi:lipopolysaccharide biosynthesis protein [Pseudoalteromonas sp. NCIMB_1079]|uniref:lipopolysaccharide biosynthesis protein n=1 Tax=Pseudoalteromonas sp. NCIMB 1079 TaxID=3142847 RepID=UPI00339BA1E6
MQNSEKNKRVIKNTLFLYIRMILVLGISLYTSRLVLDALGIEDYGIYNVVAGIVTMMSFMTGAMSASTQRFLSYEHGSATNRVKDIFKMSVNIHAVIFILVVVLMESIGLWFLNNKLNIPAERLYAANWAYQCALISFGFSIMGIPYIASIISNEKMGAFAYIGVLEVSLKLIVAFTLYLSLGDNLVVYSILIVFSSAFIWSLYFLFCKYKIEDTKYALFWDMDLFKKLLGFTGWNLIGNIAVVTMNQGLNVLLNIFFGPALNASRAISNQVNMAIRSFSSNLQMSMNPLITKSYASGEHEYMQSLILKGSKYSFFLLLILTLPVLLQTEQILSIWLGQLPEKVIIFCQLSLVDSLVISLSGALIVGAQANGNIKIYQIVTGGVLLLNLPLSYLLFVYGAKPEAAMALMVVISTIAFSVRLLFMRKMIGLSIRVYCRVVLSRVFLVALFSFLIMWYLDSLMGDTFLYLIVESFTSMFVVISTIWLLGLEHAERKFILNKLSAFYSKLKAKSSS